MHVFGIDPGKASGILWAHYGRPEVSRKAAFEDVPLQILESYLLDFDLLVLWEDLHRWESSTRYEDRRVIYEAWQDFSHQHSVDSAWAQHNIGVVLLFCQKYGIHVTARRPGVPKISRLHLERAGYWVSGPGDDQRSIIKHTLQQLCDEHHKPTMDRLWARENALS